ncbi:SPOR domain-containing protein [Aliarcobacter skirrowii]|uniref:SPOR domain-containing protein n=1 Tax=Aliarcobacter skirrowii TaxID=28200 RepID=UPI00082C50E0|nr:SPOR domain-containing protein [Aliarcobacter skirrowii]MCT7447087.1 SPOR domain-containing protein [Aliarcobacter skirrowii]MDX3959231.1 SPOR domain-containing protein [Aliarcobacter skirrowii]MDX4040245.1 SPOR domain-containing protein [Aliarcobacter skirrowii]MDX4064190.1 SPOR domain-containing protein [Aliarcobacter skirrowii]MDX4066009.1 SPOR domain-containing protein [Aliarcobacter skirrowii]
MQISGDDFLKKVQLKQEGEELKRKLNELNQAESNMQNLNLSNSLNSAYNSDNSYEEIQRLQNNIELENSNDEFDSLILEKRSNRSDNKKKYLMLGAILLVLFLLTVVIVGLLSNKDKKGDPFMPQDSSSSDTNISKESSIEESYQKILDDTNRKSAEQSLEDIKENDSLDNLNSIKEIVQEPKETTITNEDLDKTIQKIEEKKSVAPVVKVEEKKAPSTQNEPKKSIRELVEGKSTQNSATKAVETTTSTSKGFYVQIGAFKNRPDSAYLQKIKQNGFEYKIIEESNLNKLLIGPYSSRANANTQMPNIKTKLNIQSAFIKEVK